MYARLLLICLLFCFKHLSGQVASSCVVPDTIRITHDRDARDMALERMYATHSPDTVLIEVPQPHIDTIMRGLAAIYNLDTAQEADSVFTYWCVHTYRGFAEYKIQVKVDTSYAWTHPWATLHTYTSYGALDSFLWRHGFTVTYYSCASWYADMNNIATLTTTHTLNMNAFADSILLFPGVEYTQKELPVGWGSVIHYDNATGIYTFYKGWGDCPMGCTGGKTWKYAVDDACAVTLLSATLHGWEPYPPYPDCTYHPPVDPPPPHSGVAALSILNTVSVYPNPATDVLHIEATNSNSRLRYTITDLMGRSQKTGSLTSSGAIGLINLPNGCYIVELRDEHGNTRHEKLLKQ